MKIMPARPRRCPAPHSRAAIGLDAALKEIARGKGVVYDPAAADACVRLFTENRFGFRE